MQAGLQDDAWQVIPTAWVRAAMARWEEGGRAWRTLDAVGVDVARGGLAKTVLAKRYGTWFAPLLKYAGTDTPDGPHVVGLVQQALADGPAALVCIDSLGVGSSPLDWLRASQVRVNPVNSAEATDATDRSGLLRFRNIRAFAWWTMREYLDPASNFNLALPPDNELLADLTAPRWKPTIGGILVEPKEDVCKRLGRSCDAGDAVVYSTLVPTL
jgi:hypothetical protein